MWGGQLAGVSTTGPSHGLAKLRVADLTRDERLRERLADECERWAKRTMIGARATG